MLSSSIGSPVDEQETRPLLQQISGALVSRIWFGFTVGALVASWCVLDSWNHDMSSGLFNFSESKGLMAEGHSDVLVGATEPFKYTMTLAFVQFAFSGLVFCMVFVAKAAATGTSVRMSLAKNAQSFADWRWPSLVVTHLFSSVLLQSLMLPTQMMSLGLFAASRSVEIPAATVVRASVFKTHFGGHAMHTVLAMSAAAWILFFSYSQISECLCIWSGFGVALTGVPLYFVYILVLIVPATNVVLQESVLVQLQACPLFMQGISNIFAALLFIPVLFAVHWLGYEDVQLAAKLIGSQPEVRMTVVWLCVQTVLISAVTASLVLIVDSFWTISARSLRVAFWWARQLQHFYLSSSTLLSVAQPHASAWSMGIIVGICIALSAFVTDVPSQHGAEKITQESTKGLGIGKYV